MKVANSQTGNVYMWDKNKFLKRQAVMMEIYQMYEVKGDRAYKDLAKVHVYFGFMRLNE